MNKLILVVTVLVFIIPTKAQKATEKDKVVNLIKQFDKAIAQKDSLTLKKILDEDFVGSIPNGQSFNKKSCITYHCSPVGKVRELKDEPATGWNIKISNDCAIVNRVVTYLVNTPGKEKPTEIKVKRLEVCLKVKGKWMIASVQGTEVLKK